MSNRIITISRQFGSGGRTIGKKVAEKLGIPCYDRELIAELAKDSGFAESYIERDSEYIHSSWFSSFSAGYVSPQDTLWFSQCKLIRQLAEKESCVIVGRCADYILKDKADCLNVFIHADPEFRAKRIVEVYNDVDVPPMRRIKEKDKSRAAYYLHYTDITWGDVENYDVALDSARLGINKCVDIIAGLY